MRLSIPCPGCQQILQMPAELAGKPVKCPHCGKAFRTPAPAAPAPPAAPPTAPLAAPMPAAAPRPPVAPPVRKPPVVAPPVMVQEAASSPSPASAPRPTGFSTFLEACLVSPLWGFLLTFGIAIALVLLLTGAGWLVGSYGGMGVALGIPVMLSLPVFVIGRLWLAVRICGRIMHTSTPLALVVFFFGLEVFFLPRYWSQVRPTALVYLTSGSFLFFGSAVMEGIIKPAYIAEDKREFALRQEKIPKRVDPSDEKSPEIARWKPLVDPSPHRGGFLPAQHLRIPQEQWTLPRHTSRFLAVERLGVVDVWNLESGEKLAQLPALDGSSKHALSDNGKWLASENSKTVQLVEIATGRVVWNKPLSGRVAFCGDDLLGVLGDQESLLLEIKTGETRKTLPGISWDRGAFSGGGRFFALDKPRLRIIDLKTDEHFVLSDDGGGEIAFSPDGKWLASGGLTGTVRIFDLETGAFKDEKPTGPFPKDMPVASFQLRWRDDSKALFTDRPGGSIPIAGSASDEQPWFADHLKSFERDILRHKDSTSKAIPVHPVQGDPPLVVATKEPDAKTWPVKADPPAQAAAAAEFPAEVPLPIQGWTELQGLGPISLRRSGNCLAVAARTENQLRVQVMDLSRRVAVAPPLELGVTGTSWDEPQVLTEPTGKYLAIACTFGRGPWEVGVYEVASRKCLGVIAIKEIKRHSLKLLSDGHLLAVAEQKLQRWNPAGTILVAEHKIDQYFGQVVVSPGQHLAAVWHHNNKRHVILFSLAEGLSPVVALDIMTMLKARHGGALLAFSPDGKELALAHEDNSSGKSLAVFELSSGRLIRQERIKSHTSLDQRENEMSYSIAGDALLFADGPLDIPILDTAGKVVAKIPHAWRGAKGAVGILVDRGAYLRPLTKIEPGKTAHKVETPPAAAP